jgi:hypothetical protein
MELPKYECHKIVHALKIENILRDGDSADGYDLVVEAPFTPIPIDGKWVRERHAYAGGYYVVYEDGYASFSPADVFEAGYKRLD